MADDAEQECAMRILMFMVLAISATTAPAADFGRLFFTPQQRAQLDSEYARTASAEGDSGVVMVNGVVQRKGGDRTVWVNGVPRAAGKSDERNPASVSVSVPGKRNPVKMKVGQRLLLEPPDTSRDDGQ
jgi:hypothetical protein